MAPPTKTSRSPVRTGRSTSTAQGRFARNSAASRTQGMRRRKPPQKSGVSKILGAVIPTGAAKKAAPSSKTGKAGGFALVAAAAGMAFKNRGKLSQLRRKDDDTPSTPTTGVNATPAVPPSSPSV